MAVVKHRFKVGDEVLVVSVDPRMFNHHYTHRFVGKGGPVDRIDYTYIDRKPVPVCQVAIGDEMRYFAEHDLMPINDLAKID